MKHLAIFCAVVIGLVSCKVKENSKSSTELSGPAIMKVGDQVVTTQEFQYIYNKNNSRSEDAYSEASLKEYLDLFVNFKLKVLEAESQKLDTATSFINELNGYKKQLAKPYLTEKGFTEKLAKEAYERMKEEVATSHILIKIGREADPKDTIKAWNKITSIHKEVLAGADFGDMAFENSEDPSAQMTEAPLGFKGNLGYFTALSLVYEYENMAYSTPVGEVSKPFRTQFGYHILKVSDRRKSEGKVKVSHIMVRAADGLDAEDSLEARRKIDEIRGEVVGGGDWNQLCTQFSDHNPTKARGGQLKPFSLGGQLGLPSFEKVAFSLQEVGEVSAPVKTPFGWHIIRLDEKITLKPYEEMEADLKKRVAKDGRSQLNRKALISRLKTENDFVLNEKTKTSALAKADSSLLKGVWTPTEDQKADETTLFSIDGNDYPVKDFYAYIQKAQRPRKKISPAYAIELMYETYEDQEVYAFEEDNLEDKYLDYKMLVKEYRDGILLFQLMDENVWSKAIKDTSGLRDFYNTNSDDYKWDQRTVATLYSCADASIVARLKGEIEKNVSEDDLLGMFNAESSLNLQIENDTYEKGDNIILDMVKWEPGMHEANSNGRAFLVNIKEVLPEGQKKLSEARGLIISDYQNELEKQWISELKKQYPVEIHDTEVNSLIKD